MTDEPGTDEPGTDEPVALDPVLLAVVRCPQCRGELAVGDAELTCSACGLAYPVRDGIPVLLIDEAREVGR